MRTPLILLILSLFITSCFKRDESNVNAPCNSGCMTFITKVTTGQNSSEPVDNAVVELSWAWPATPLGNPGRLIAKGRTGSDGMIVFNFKANEEELEGGRYMISAKKGLDYFQQHNQYYGIQRFDTTVNADVHLPSKATVRIVYRNFQPVAPDDFFQCLPGFQTYGSMPIAVELTDQSGNPQNGFFFNHSPEFTEKILNGATAGDQYTYFTITKKRNGVREDVKDSIFIPKGGIGVYEVSYN